MIRIIAAALLLAGAAQAQEVPSEVHTLGKQKVTLHLHTFLTGEETATLRVVATNQDALNLFLTRPGRHAAIAVAPAEGFIRAGQPVASASALSDLPRPEAARAGALEVCNKARAKGPECVVVLEVAPGS